ncbi:hypothetical protein NDU88_003479 [Pleurodeles waltl]|uniref:Uncharacterized protein n=1 Tax=Pleurodeles waltl TaxID=8319 RepID=A0AAV7M4Q7_PLEWA|nr:hypothetical protein NDU88_003479 [Pleurodeles waltl]
MEEPSTRQRAGRFLHGYGFEEEVLDEDEGDEVEEGETVQERDRKEEKVGDRMAFNGGKSVGVFEKKTEKTVQCGRRGGREERTMTTAHIPRGERRGNLFESGEVTQCVSVAVGNSPVVKINLCLKSRGKDMGIQADVESDGKVGSDVTNSDVVDTAKGAVKAVPEPGSPTQVKAVDNVGDVDVYQLAKKQLQERYGRKINVVLKRYKFYSRTQHDDEFKDQFVSALRGLAFTCNFEQISYKQVLRDQI